MKCVGVCGLEAQCDEYQMGGNEKAVLTYLYTQRGWHTSEILKLHN